jgi:2-methylisocitrate lyase-like PEP mutase family enzyme
MADQVARAHEFARLHIPGDPVVIFNAWDAGSAQAVAMAGARAIGTGSWSVAAAHGYPDGEQLPLELALANLERIVRVVELPVSIDFEAGYGESADEVERSVARAIRSGAVGINLEDGFADEEGIRPLDEQVARIRAARAAANHAKVPLYINARTDFFLQADPAAHDAEMLRSAIERAAAYATAGASGLFVPGIVDREQIRAVCASTALPVNVLMMPSVPSREELARLGVARISHGPGPYRAAMGYLERIAREALGNA